MNCRDAKEHLGAYLDGALTAADARTVETHVAQCADCRNELTVLRGLAGAITATPTAPPPADLWLAIERRLEPPARLRLAAKRRFQLSTLARVAAAILIVAGLTAWFIAGPNGDGPTANASAVDFRVLLDALPLDPQKAFRRFLVRYDAVPIQASDAKAFAPALNFEAPETLPGGFRRVEIYGLQFGDSPGLAVRYDRDGEFLAALFHRAVHREDYGTHHDNACVVGMHRGHKVEVGPWRLVHVTDPTTCHCVLSQLDEATELPPVLAAVAPRAHGPSAPDDHHHGFN